MLEMVGLGIEMGNGSERLKAAAEFITRNASDDGIEHALHKLHHI
ncbi:HAD hydrolase family protein [Planococcus shixiaomingii]